jgi:hypothetical protein
MSKIKWETEFSVPSDDRDGTTGVRFEDSGQAAIMAEEYLTAEQVLAEIDDFCQNKGGNPAIAVMARKRFAIDGQLPLAAIKASLKLIPVTVYKRVK